MAKVTITENILENIATAIRTKAGTENLMRPSEMPAAINAIETGGYPEPTGTINITQNGTENVKDYAAANVNVPNSYSASDEGKVVNNGALVAQGSQTITQNGTYDTTLIDEVVVNVSGGGSGAVIEPLSVTQNGTYTPPSGVDGYAPVTVNVSSGGIPTWLREEALYAQDYDSSSETVEYAVGITSTSSNPSISASLPTVPIADWVSTLGLFAVDEYYDYVPDGLIAKLGLVLLGDFSEGGSATDNVLNDAIDNYSTIWLQGMYGSNKTSNYNTTRIYIEPELDVPYWTGMKDRNGSYTCRVTFTDTTHCDLSGNRRVLIYGMP